MIASLFTKIFGSRNDRLLRKYRPVVARINGFEPALSALSDEALTGKTAEFRQQLENGKTLDDLLPEAFAVVREASKRVLGMRHFDVQLVGGIMLHSGRIAEMRTGEGKTLTATLAVYLNALAGKGVHVVTVNDYLASRDAEMMGRLYGFLGMTTGVNLSRMAQDKKHVAYAADITYGTNNEFGFDYLRDNMVYSLEERVQRSLNYAIVDEVDSILIDEARTPLIISGQADDHTDLYVRLNTVAPQLKRCEVEDGPGDYWVDEKAHTVLLTEAGHEHAEDILTQEGLLEAGRSLYEPANITLVHFLYASLRAHNLYLRDQQYVVQNGEVIIVDEFTGRLSAGTSRGRMVCIEAVEREGRRADPGRESDARLDHLPELLPHVRKAGRHDRHGGHGSLRIPPDLWSGNGRDTDPSSDDPQGHERSGVSNCAGKVCGSDRRHQGLPRAWPAGAGGHDLDRKL